MDVCRLIFFSEILQLVARYTELENQQIQLNLNLKLAQENLKKAQEEAKGMAGEVLHSYWVAFLSCPFLMLVPLDASQINWRKL